MGRPGQDALLERTPDLRADIVVTGLPVQPEALCDALLDAIQPRLIIVADSEFPAAERASPKLRERLARRKVPVIYTRTAGAATIEWRKHDWEVRTMSGIRISSRQPIPLPEPPPQRPSDAEPTADEEEMCLFDREVCATLGAGSSSPRAIASRTPEAAHISGSPRGGTR